MGIPFRGDANLFRCPTVILFTTFVTIVWDL
ncbi:hypothetical protein LINPERHAP1_LOCUS7458 [Linum perenne]